jgi:hypothetical protein
MYGSCVLNFKYEPSQCKAKQSTNHANEYYVLRCTMNKTLVTNCGKIKIEVIVIMIQREESDRIDFHKTQKKKQNNKNRMTLDETYVMRKNNTKV